MAVNISGLRRNIKNVAHNYTDAQVKVREATSNDPWGPSSTMMSEIADLTYDVVAFSEIMQMVWKRLNDHGKNWRHVYKALVLLEYLIKTGSEKVAQQCKENIYAIQTLKDFQYLDDNKDQGINVREKAKALVALLKDDERLKNERVRALKAKERFAQSTAGIGSDTVYNHTRDRFEPHNILPQHPPEDLNNPEIEAARPQTAGEEELQLQLALAMSREEAEQEETKGKSDEMGLKMALEKSNKEKADEKKKQQSQAKPSSDLLDLDFGNPAAPNAVSAFSAGNSSSLSQPPPPPRTVGGSIDPWGMPAAGAPSRADSNSDPWGGAAATTRAITMEEPMQTSNDPWSPVGASSGMRASPAMPMSTSPAFNQAPTVISQQNSVNPWKTAAAPTSAMPPGYASSLHPTDPDSIDPFSPAAQYQLAEFDMLRAEIETKNGVKGANNGGGGGALLQAKPSNGKSNGGSTSPNPFDLNDLTGTMSDSAAAAAAAAATGAKPKKTVQSLLGEHSKLVNLDDLGSAPAAAGERIQSASNRNPFEQQPPNPFQAKTQKPAINELIQQNSTWGGQQQQQPQQREAEFNPFF